jgi:hypothetical protein
MSTAINKLPEKSRSKIQDLLDDIKSGGHYFVIKADQRPQKITRVGKVKRTISVPNGNIREINRHTFSIWNHTYQVNQQLSLSNKWVKRLLLTLPSHNTNTVIVKRTLS